jgi:hypothetical protein
MSKRLAEGTDDSYREFKKKTDKENEEFTARIREIEGNFGTLKPTLGYIYNSLRAIEREAASVQQYQTLPIQGSSSSSSSLSTMSFNQPTITQAQAQAQALFSQQQQMQQQLQQQQQPPQQQQQYQNQNQRSSRGGRPSDPNLRPSSAGQDHFQQQQQTVASAVSQVPQNLSRSQGSQGNNYNGGTFYQPHSSNPSSGSR